MTITKLSLIEETFKRLILFLSSSTLITKKVLGYLHVPPSANGNFKSKPCPHLIFISKLPVLILHQCKMNLAYLLLGVFSEYLVSQNYILHFLKKD